MKKRFQVKVVEKLIVEAPVPKRNSDSFMVTSYNKEKNVHFEGLGRYNCLIYWNGISFPSVLVVADI